VFLQTTPHSAGRETSAFQQIESPFSVHVYLPLDLPPGIPFPDLSPGLSAAGFAIAGPPIGLDCSPSFPLPLSPCGAIRFALQLPTEHVNVAYVPIRVDATTPITNLGCSSRKRNPSPCVVSGGNRATISPAHAGGATCHHAHVLRWRGRGGLGGSPMRQGIFRGATVGVRRRGRSASIAGVCIAGVQLQTHHLRERKRDQE
jgi:hypothetical protein